MSIILIDMDDVIEDLCSAWLSALNLKHHLKVKVDDVCCWDMHLIYPQLSSEEIYAPLFEESFWKTVKPKKGAAKYIKKLMDDGNDIYICTTSDYRTLVYKFDNVLFKHFPFISQRQIIVTHNKQLIYCDYIIDDGVHNLINSKGKPLLFDCSHNRNFDEKSCGITRVKSWKEIYDIINLH